MSSKQVEKLHEAILPSNDRLLAGVKSALQRIAQRSTDDHTKSELGAIDVIIGELILRHQSTFYVGFYADLLALIEEGRELLGAKLSADASAIIRAVVATLPATLAPSLDADTIGIHTNAALRCLEILVEASRGDAPAPLQAYVSRVVAKENEYQAHRIPAAASPTIEQPAYTVFTLETMQTYMRSKFLQRQGLRVTQFKQLDAGLPVAEPLWLESDAAKMGYRFFVSRKVPGINYGSAISADKPSRRMSPNHLSRRWRASTKHPSAMPCAKRRSGTGWIIQRCTPTAWPMCITGKIKSGWSRPTHHRSIRGSLPG